ncbi:rhomboid family intramembrane serine protease [Paenibacillus humicola]|uniref:rhomboid family intramembrane serine protease n=1 Tax=Paenibacillus humicola TaxID=3110540 RepID=UPI00237C50A7|nr:rhomboid family intramembrane serine protease [Paenibacillus humicola]
MNQTKTHRYPIVLITVFLLTTVFTLLQFVYPEVLEQLRRNPAALERGEWWRVVTSLLVHADGWTQYALNMVCLLLIGYAAERLFGHGRFLLLYLAGGLIGQLAGYAGWDPFGAGASVGFCGVSGGICVAALSRTGRVNPVPCLVSIFFVVGLLISDLGNLYIGIVLIVAAGLVVPAAKRMKDARRGLEQIAGAATLAGALILLSLRDIHGAAIVGGACAALLLRLLGGKRGLIREKGGALL